MSRTIRLTKIHALNWYGYKDTISIEGNLLLAGVTGSGKSILMDLVQFVLVGDERLVRFNQSATGGPGDRGVKGYCLGDLKDDENGVPKYMHQSVVTYAALEFTWPSGKRSETWGIRVEFSNAAETHGKRTPFFIPADLQRGDFLDSKKCPLDYTAFKALVESREGRIYPEGLDAYLRDMAQPTHLNFDRAVLRALLPTAMSFTFLKSFDDFARNFILPADKLDVGDVTASYRTFLAYEHDLKDLNEQFTKLKTIRDTFTRWTDLRRDRALSRFLEVQLRHEHAAEELAEIEKQLATLKAENAGEEKRLAELVELIERGRVELRKIDALIGQSPEGQLYKFIKGRNAELTHQISSLTGIGKSLEDALANRLHNARSWLKELRALPLELDATPVNTVERAIQAVDKGGVAKAGETLPTLGSTAQNAAAVASRAANPAQKRLAEVRQQLGQLRDEIAALKIGKLPFPTRLLDALNNSLRARGPELPARHLRELCEVTDERWRPAIEIAFTRKFAIVVAPEHYEQAEKIYHSLKPSDFGGDAGRESLVNPAKALQRGKSIRPGSLAEKMKANHPVAEAVIGEAFGNLTCVESLAQLRALPPEQNGILPDGFMSRGAFVERRRFYDGNPFVGQKGLEQQRAWKEKQAEDLANEERKLLPIERALKSLADGWREHFEIAPNLYQDLARAQELPRLQDELKENIAKLNRIDRSKFDELAKEQSKLETDLKAMEDERRALDRSEKRGKVRALEAQVESARGEVGRLDETFKRVRDETDVSPWLKRLEELRSNKLARFPAKDVAANQFNDLFHDCHAKAEGAWEALKAQRRELATAFSKFDDLPVEVETNDAHDKQLAKLEESEIPEYTQKAERERKNWEGLFRTQVLEKLQSALHSVRDLIFLLNNSLKQKPIGNNTYQLRYWQNPDFKIYHELVDASALARADELFFASAEPRFRDAIQYFLKTLTEAADSAEAARLLDYRHYYEYDMEVIEADGRKTSVDRHSGKFSGGENQSPYFIAILASYLRAYRRYASRRQEPSLGLVPIDEAFSKLSGERIKDCITALKAFDLQGMFSMSTGNIPYAFEHCDWLVVVSKEERRLGKRTEIRNIPVSLARDSEDARRLMNS